MITYHILGEFYYVKCLNVVPKTSTFVKIKINPLYVIVKSILMWFWKAEIPNKMIDE